MITLLTGENSFELERALRRIVSNFDGTAEKIDGSEIVTRQLPDLLMGGTLFADKRLVVIKNLSDNKTVWADFEQWISRISDDNSVVLVEPKADKRTKTYKILSKVATVHEFPLWREYDTNKAEIWAVTEARSLGFVLDKKSVQALINRVGIDQWLLSQALQKLAVLDEITPAVIQTVIEANPTENVFNLFDAALRGNTAGVVDMLRTIELHEDPYRLFGLLSGQAFQLAALCVTDKTSSEVAKDLGVNPYGLSKMTSVAKKLGPSGAKKMMSIFADADAGMKTSLAEPWLLIERALIKISRI